MSEVMIAENAVGIPCAALQPYVGRYVGYRYEGMAEGIHHGLPSRYVTLVVSLDEPLDILRGINGEPPAAFDVCFGGLHTAPVTLRMPVRQRGYQLGLLPLGVRTLIGCSADEVAGHCFELRDIIGSRANELRERLTVAATWADGFAIIDDVFARELRRLHAPTPEVAWAWREMTLRRGSVAVAALAEEVGWSRRTFAERFRTELGLTPKAAARVLRFEYSTQLLKSGRVRSLAELAIDSGYYDQAHMTREWRDLAGSTPGEWIARELPFVQDPGALGEED